MRLRMISMVAIAPRGVVALLSAVVLLSLLAAACGGGGGGSSTVRRTLRVGLEEWAVTPEVEETQNGRLSLEVTNAGKVPHKLVVLKSDFPPQELPVVDGAVDVAKLNVEGQTDTLAAGSTATLNVDLSPGKYVLLCTIVERPPGQPVVSHYAEGMYAGFFVQP